jgi:hypothetical protein
VAAVYEVNANPDPCSNDNGDSHDSSFTAIAIRVRRRCGPGKRQENQGGETQCTGTGAEKLHRRPFRGFRNLSAFVIGIPIDFEEAERLYAYLDFPSIYHALPGLHRSQNSLFISRAATLYSIFRSR